MPDCIHYEDLCSASVDGTLTREEKKELEAHLKTCPACREYLEDMRAMRALWRELDHPLPDGLHASIMAAVEADRAVQMPESAPQPVENAPRIRNILPPHLFRRAAPVLGMLAAAAACVTIVLTGGLAGIVGGENMADTASAAVVQRSVQTTEDAVEAAPFTAIAPASGASGQAAAAPESAPAEEKHEITDMETDQTVGVQAAAAGVQAAAAGVEPVVKLPEALGEHHFAAAYLAAGSGELPTIEGAVLLLEEDGRSYYSLPDDVAVLESMIEALPGAGYTVSVINAEGAGTEAGEADQNTTGEILLVVVTMQ